MMDLTSERLARSYGVEDNHADAMSIEELYNHDQKPKLKVRLAALETV